MALQQHLQLLQQINEHDRKESVIRLSSIFSSILKNPFDAKYQRLNFNKISTQFVKCPVCIELLYDAGFKITKNGKKLIFNINKMKSLKIVNTKLQHVLNSIHDHDDNKIEEINNQNNIKQSEYEGNISIPDPRGDINCWGVLSECIVSFYKNQTNMDQPYDVINLSQFYAMEECTSSAHQFGIRFFDKNGHEQLLYAFENKKLRSNWFDAILRSIKVVINHNVKDKNNKTEHIVQYRGWVLMNKKHLLFMELRRHTICLYNIKEDTALGKKRLSKTINLHNFTVKCNSAISNAKNSLFKHTLTLTKTSQDSGDQDILFSFKNNNDRYEWMSHIDYIIDTHGRSAQQDTLELMEEKTNNMHDLKNSQENSFQFLLSTLQLYFKWLNENDPNKKALSSILKKQLNANYSTILNHFHIIIRDYKYINNKTNKCADSKCTFLSRHTSRDRNRNSNNNNSLLNELLDKIHFHIYHANNQNENTIFAKHGNHKFVINTQNEENKNNFIENDINQINQSAKFAFGEHFAYYDFQQNNPGFIVPKFSCLKEELLQNPYYKMYKNQYNEYYLQALKLKQPNEFGKKFTAKLHGMMNALTEVKINQIMSINHIISLLIYCNETEAQKTYKQHSRRLYPNEPLQRLWHRQSYVAHWTRYLYESCQLYGELLPPDAVVYCGMDKKLLFDSFTFRNYSPLSTSSCLTVAAHFAANKGVILALKREDDNNCHYMDMRLFSNYIAEKERFFCGLSDFKIYDIIIGDKSHKAYISALTLLENVLRGSLFYYKWNKHLYENEIQNILCELLKNYIDNKNKTEYVQQLTNALIESFINRNIKNDPSGTKYMFINPLQIKKLNSSLLSYFYRSSSEKGILLSPEKGILLSSEKFSRANRFVSFVERIQIKLDIKKLKQMKYFKEGEIKIADFITTDNNKFDLTLWKSKEQNKDYFAIGMYLKSKMSGPVSIYWDIVCKQIKYRNIHRFSTFCQDNNYFCGMRTFLCSKINKLSYLKMDFIARDVSSDAKYY